MARAQQPSMAAVVGMLAGMLLLCFAGTLFVSRPSSLTEGERRLQVVNATANATTFNSSTDSSGTSSSGSFASLKAFKSFESSSFRSSSAGVRSSGAMGEGALSMFLAMAGTVWGQLVLMLIFACVYHKKAVAPILENEGTLADKDLEFTGDDDFENGICGCFDDKWVCIHGLCCPLVRMAQTNAVAGVCGFWETAACFFCCSLFSAGLGPCCLMVYWRKQVKEVMGIEDHLVNDICCTLFFPLLSLCQQATAVDRAMGYEVTGCCTLKSGLAKDGY